MVSGTVPQQKEAPIYYGSVEIAHSATGFEQNLYSLVSAIIIAVLKGSRLTGDFCFRIS